MLPSAGPTIHLGPILKALFLCLIIQLSAIMPHVLLVVCFGKWDRVKSALAGKLTSAHPYVFAAFVCEILSRTPCIEHKLVEEGQCCQMNKEPSGEHSN